MLNNFRQKMICIFNDTEQWYQANDDLRAAIERTINGTKIYLEGDDPSMPKKNFDRTRLEINRQRSFEAARNAHAVNPSARIGVLNFASATTPGGGVKRGAGAQEESLCRCSTLYPTLVTSNNRTNFYAMHRQRHDPLHTDACIYAPDVIVIKSDTQEPERLAQSEWLTVDVITCAAPKLRQIEIDDERLLEIHVARGRHLLTVAAHHGIDTMILGAFGCGAFMNDPNVVASAYKKILPDFDGVFDKIIFAVYCSPKNDRNFVAFDHILNVH